MDYDLIVPAAASLLGVLLGVRATLVGQRRQWKEDRKVGGQNERKLAVQELAVSASSLDMASHQAVSVTAAFGTPAGQLNRLIGIVTPLDPQTLFDGMNGHFERLNRAAAQLRLAGDQETVRLTNAVMFAAAEVIEAHHAAPASRNVVRQVLRWIFSRVNRGNQGAIETARASLSEAVRVLVEYTRKQIDEPHVDLWALPEKSEAG